MEKPGHETDIAGSRRTHLKKSFKSTLRHLLTACSKQDFVDIFSKFSGAEQELLFQLYTRVVVNLHQTIEVVTLCSEIFSSCCFYSKT
jgi:hypothetical protein